MNVIYLYYYRVISVLEMRCHLLWSTMQGGQWLWSRGGIMSEQSRTEQIYGVVSG